MTAAPGRARAAAPARSLAIATRAFYWKPVYAFLRAFELEEFARAGVGFRRPVLDLGSGDGTFASMLRERGVLEGIDVSIEHGWERLRGRRPPAARGAVRGDARALPVRTGALGSALSNAVVCCIPTDDDRDIDGVFAEVHRALAPGGAFALTVATVWYNRNLPIPRLMVKLGARRRAERYLSRLDRGLEHHQVYEEERWRGKLERAGFRIEAVRRYFTPRQAAWWNVLTLQVFRVFALTRLLPLPAARRAAAAAQRALFGRLFASEQALPDASPRNRAGYVLIVARKPQ